MEMGGKQIFEIIFCIINVLLSLLIKLTRTQNISSFLKIITDPKLFKFGTIFY